MKKRKLTKELRRELGMQTRKLEKLVQSSPYGETIRRQKPAEEEALEIANLLSVMCLEKLVIDDLGHIANPTEDQIAQRVAFNLQRQADMLAAFGETLMALSKMTSEAVLTLKVDCPAD
jgi:hypothetical protein